MKLLIGEKVLKDIEKSLGAKNTKPLTGNFKEKVKDNKVS